MRAQSVHPHRRGEHDAAQFTTKPTVGSSPQAWGTLFSDRELVFLSRFIPTGVGNTAKMMVYHQMYPVHPHRRGEH